MTVDERRQWLEIGEHLFPGKRVYVTEWTSRVDDPDRRFSVSVHDDRSDVGDTCILFREGDTMLTAMIKAIHDAPAEIMVQD